MTTLETMKTLKTNMFRTMGFEVEDKDDYCINVERINRDGSCLVVHVPSKMLQITQLGYVLNLNDTYGVFLKSWQLNHTDDGYEVLLVLDLFEPIITNSGLKTRFTYWHDATAWTTWLDVAYVQAEKDAKWDVML